MVQFMLQNKVEKRKLESYNIPLYFATAEEVREVIEEEGSFHVERMEKIIFDAESVVEIGNDEDEDTIGERITKSLRATTEAMFKAEFGEEITDEMYTRFKSKFIQLRRVKKLMAPILIAYITKHT
ncbi:hypothetical protein PIB30_010588 [Stylosanthes scabra]|uniref:Uncharacterized protein n=1 Tax=Stylosanthes scabra TaxID=79078 RepID=A0ABU6S5E6_9FABA|nr:hypothetical protein [Stylosanthes scabra]